MASKGGRDKGSERQAGQQDVLPRIARSIANVLKGMGVTEYDPAIIPQLIEFSHRMSQPRPLAHRLCILIPGVSNHAVLYPSGLLVDSS